MLLMLGVEKTLCEVCECTVSIALYLTLSIAVSVVACMIHGECRCCAILTHLHSLCMLQKIYFFIFDVCPVVLIVVVWIDTIEECCL